MELLTSVICDSYLLKSEVSAEWKATQQSRESQQLNLCPVTYSLTGQAGHCAVTGVTYP